MSSTSGLGGFLGLGHFFLGPPPLGHVLHRQHQQLPVMPRLQLAGIEQHHPPPDGGKVVLQLKVVKEGTLGDNVFEERS